MLSEEISFLRAESPKGIASLSSTAAGLLQSFFKSANKFLTSRKPSVGKVSAEPMSLMIDRLILSRIESLSAASTFLRNSDSAPSLPTLPRAVKSETV